MTFARAFFFLLLTVLTNNVSGGRGSGGGNSGGHGGTRGGYPKALHADVENFVKKSLKQAIQTAYSTIKNCNENLHDYYGYYKFCSNMMWDTSILVNEEFVYAARSVYYDATKYKGITLLIAKAEPEEFPFNEYFPEDPDNPNQPAEVYVQPYSGFPKNPTGLLNPSARRIVSCVTGASSDTMCTVIYNGKLEVMFTVK